MRSGRPITRLLSAVGLVLFLAGVAPSAADAAGAGVSQMSQLSQPRGDVLEDGRVVVSFAAAGDLRGLLTLTLTPAGDGSYDGQWAIMVTHADTTDPETGLEPEIEEHVEVRYPQAPNAPRDVGAEVEWAQRLRQLERPGRGGPGSRLGRHRCRTC